MYMYMYMYMNNVLLSDGPSWLLEQNMMNFSGIKSVEHSKLDLIERAIYE